MVFFGLAWTARYELLLLARIVLGEALAFAQVAQVSLAVLWDRLVVLRGDTLARALLCLSLLCAGQRVDMAGRVCTDDWRPRISSILVI